MLMTCRSGFIEQALHDLPNVAMVTLWHIACWARICGVTFQAATDIVWDLVEGDVVFAAQQMVRLLSSVRQHCELMCSSHRLSRGSEDITRTVFTMPPCPEDTFLNTRFVMAISTQGRAHRQSATSRTKPHDCILSSFAASITHNRDQCPHPPSFFDSTPAGPPEPGCVAATQEIV